MIQDRWENRRPVICVLIAVGLLTLSAGVADSTVGRTQPTQTRSDSGQQAGGASRQLQELMTERYEILKSIVESLETFLAAGRTSLSEWRDAKVALYRAQADLCTDTAERVKVYEEMVDFLRNAERLARQRADTGRMTEVEVKQARLTTIEAQIGLEKLRLGQAQ